MLNVMSALGLLLLMQGPTNTLLLRSGVLSGFRRAWPLSLLEYLAYLLGTCSATSATVRPGA